MRHDVYSLPEVMFVAGQSNTLRWRLFTEQNVPFNAEGCTGNFALVDYSDKYNDEPLVSKPLSFLIGDDTTGAKNIATVDLYILFKLYHGQCFQNKAESYIA